MWTPCAVPKEVDALWLEATDVITSRLTYVEARASLASARRARRVTGRRLERVKSELDARWEHIEIVELTERLVQVAAATAEGRSLRTVDAVHLGSALLVQDAGLVFASCDYRLRGAAAAAGLAVGP
jgi:predicted nucleic acid-binding protein